MDYYVSCGLGTQSSLLAIWAAKNDPRLMVYTGGQEAKSIFADTKVEHPSTYEWFEILKEFLNQLNYRIIVVSRGDLIEEFTEKREIPSRTFRFCTTNFKRSPIRRYWRQQGSKKVKVFIGFTYEEDHRIRASDVKWCENVYPFIELEMTREDCVKEIMNYGLPEPPRSGCYCCPFQRKKEIYRLKSEHPELFKRVLRMETRALERNPKLKIMSNVNLKDLDKMTKLDDFFEVFTPCSEYCMT